MGRSWAYSGRAGQHGARHTLVSVHRRRARSLRAAPSEHLPSPGSPAASLRLSTRSDRHWSPRPRVGAVLGLFRPCRPAWCSPCPHFSPRRSWGASFALEVCVEVLSLRWAGRLFLGVSSASVWPALTWRCVHRWGVLGGPTGTANEQEKLPLCLRGGLQILTTSQSDRSLWLSEEGSSLNPPP